MVPLRMNKIEMNSKGDPYETAIKSGGTVFLHISLGLSSLPGSCGIEARSNMIHIVSMLIIILLVH